MTHITIEKEKLEQVLESLEDLQRQYSIYPNSFWDWSKGRKAITTLMQALAAPTVQPVGDDWTPCMKLPVVVHVRQQRPGESHISTREGITPVKPDDLIMRGVSGEEYPIGRAIFEQTYTLDTTPPAQPAPTVQETVAWWVTQMDMDGKIDSFAVTSDYDYAKSVCDLDIATPRPLIFGDTTPPAQPAVPDAITDNSESPDYRAGWNECRELTIQMRKP
jgi:hypothetical protein